MQRIYEYERRSKTEWIQQAGLHEQDISELLERGVLVPTKDGCLAANYVGTVMSRNDLLAFYPAYVRDAPDTNHEQLRTLTQSMLRYIQRRQTRRAVTTENVRELVYADDAFLRRYERFSTLWRDYGRRGLYMRVEREHRRHQFRGIHWPKTVANSPAVHAAGSVLYPSPIATVRSKRSTHVTRIHAGLLMRLIDRFEPQFGPSHAEPLSLAGGTEVDLDSGQAITAVEREQGQVFRQDDSRILALILDELLDESNAAGPVALKLLGTTVFHSLWEDACATILGDEESLRANIAQPTWTRDDGTTVPGGSAHSQIPDIVLSEGDCTAILDAKYYYPYPVSRCGWQDLAKQYVYAHSYRTPGDTSIINGLLFPHLDAAPVAFLGKVALDHGPSTPSVFAPLYVFGLNPIAVFDAYASRTMRRNWLNEIIAIARAN